MGALILFGLAFLAFTSNVWYVDPLTRETQQHNNLAVKGLKKIEGR